MNLRDFFKRPDPPITYAYNPPELSRHLMGAEQPVFIPPPQKLYDLASYRTPFAIVWNRPRNVLQG